MAAGPIDGVRAGMFAGWVDSPAALLATVRLAESATTVTTFRLAPENGPVATALLESIVQRTAGAGASR